MSDNGDRDLEEPLIGEGEVVNIQNSSKSLDRFIAFLFACQLVFVLYYGLIYGYPGLKNQFDSAKTYVDSNNHMTLKSKSDENHFFWALFIVGIVALGLSIGFIYVLSSIADYVVYICLTFSVLALTICGVVFYTLGYISLGLTLLIAGVLAVILVIYLSPRIAFASSNLRVASKSLASSSLIYLVSFCGMLCQISYFVIWLLAVIGFATNDNMEYLYSNGVSYPIDQCSTLQFSSTITIFDQTLYCNSQSCNACICQNSVVVSTSSSCFTSRVFGLRYFLMILFLLWTCQVISYVVHGVVAGCVSVWWGLCPSLRSTAEWNGIPDRFRDSWIVGCLRQDAVVVNSLIHTIRDCFSSLVFAALLASFLTTCKIVLEFIVNRMSTLRKKDRMRSYLSHLQLYFVNILLFLLSLVNYLLQYFNEYSICFIIVEDMNFVDASRKTWDLFVRNGWTAILNDDIIDWLFMMINICIGVVSAIIGFMYSRFYKFSGMNRTFLVFWAFCLGYFLCRISTSILISAVNTVFVCFCNYSSYLEVHHPSSFSDLFSAWSNIRRSSSLLSATTTSKVANSSIPSSTTGKPSKDVGKNASSSSSSPHASLKAISSPLLPTKSQQIVDPSDGDNLNDNSSKNNNGKIPDNRDSISSVPSTITTATTATTTTTTIAASSSSSLSTTAATTTSTSTYSPSLEMHPVSIHDNMTYDLFSGRYKSGRP